MTKCYQCEGRGWVVGPRYSLHQQCGICLGTGMLPAEFSGEGEKQMLDRLSATQKGSIVCTGSCTEVEIAVARAQGRMWVRDDGIGFILRIHDASPTIDVEALPDLEKIYDAAWNAAKGDNIIAHEAALEAVYEAGRAHILANNPEVVKMREALEKAQEQCQFIISHTQGHEFANGVAREGISQIEAALQNKTEGL